MRSQAGSRQSAAIRARPCRSMPRRYLEAATAAAGEHGKDGKTVSGPSPPLTESAAQKVSGDDDALDLRGSLVDLEELGVAHQLLDRVLLRVAVAAEDLHRVGGDPHGGV